MKAMKFMILGIGLFFASGVQAQISVNVNLGTPPQWGPSGYSDARYYYIPDVDSYYDVKTSRFIYYSGNTWVHRKSLPTRYRNYDLYNGYKVVLTDYRGNQPYGLYKQHKVKYAKGYKGSYQKTIGQKPGNRYGNYKVKGNDNGYYKSKGHDDGNHKSKGNGNGNHKSNGNGKKH